MNTEPLACPYCNALIPADAAVRQRVPCPRCGEAFTPTRPRTSFPELREPTGRDQPGGPPDVAAPYPDVDRRLNVARKNRLVAVAVLGVMGLMAAVGLAYALYSTGERRAHDTAMPPPPRRSPLADLPAPTNAAPAVVAPVSLEALRWLPADTSVIAGVHLAELRQTEAGRNLLNHLFHIGRVDINADLLERWTGLKADAIDHVVLGVKADDAVPPRTVVVVRTLRRYDAAVVKEALGAGPVPDAAGKTLYKAKPRDGGLRPFVWFADDRTLVVGLMQKHLEAVPDRPAAGLERLPREVRDLLEGELTARTPAWIVGYSPDWRQTGAAPLVGAQQGKDGDLLGHVHGCAVQLLMADPAQILASIQCDGDDAKKALQTRLTAAKPANGALEVLPRDGPWLSLQWRGDPAGLLSELPIGKEDAEK